MPLSVLSSPGKQVSTFGLVMLDKNLIPSSSWRILADFFPTMLSISSLWYQAGMSGFRAVVFLESFGVVIIRWAERSHKDDRIRSPLERKVQNGAVVENQGVNTKSQIIETFLFIAPSLALSVTSPPSSLTAVKRDLAPLSA